MKAGTANQRPRLQSTMKLWPLAEKFQRQCSTPSKFLAGQDVDRRNCRVVTASTPYCLMKSSVTGRQQSALPCLQSRAFQHSPTREPGVQFCSAGQVIPEAGVLQPIKRTFPRCKK